MALALQRDIDTVLAGFVAWLVDRDGGAPPEVLNHQRPSAGFSNETILVDLRRGTADERFVLKLPPLGPRDFPTYDFALQARVQEAIAAAGIPAPIPVYVVDDSHWLGAPFLVMPAVEGHVVNQMAVSDRWLTKADPALNTTVYDNYVDVMAAINRVDWRAAGLADVVPQRNNAAEVAYWRQYLEWSGDGAVLVPAIADALDWCDANQPGAEPAPSLLWGDVRLGNVIFDESRAPVAVIDWEMASIGAAEHDLAWALGLDAAQEELFQRRVQGFPDHDAAVARYESQLGRSVQDLEWYEIFAIARSTAIMTRIGYLHELAGEPGPFPITDNPVVSILTRRVAEAERRLTT